MRGASLCEREPHSDVQGALETVFISTYTHNGSVGENRVDTHVHEYKRKKLFLTLRIWQSSSDDAMEDK